MDKTTARSGAFQWAGGWASCVAVALIAVSATALSARTNIVGVPDAVFVIPEVVTLVALPSARARWWRPIGVLAVAMASASVFAAPMSLAATTWYLHTSWVVDRTDRANSPRSKNSRVPAR